MDKSNFEKVLGHYETAEFIEINGPLHHFLFHGRKYCLYKTGDEKESPVFVFVDAENLSDYPHVFQFIDIPLNGTIYKGICLYENNDIVNYLLSEEDKFHDALIRLESLISLTPKQQEKEYQKEFLYYWNECSEDIEPISLFVGSDSEFKEMNLYKNSEGEYRAVAKGLKLNDANDYKGKEKKWEFVKDCPFYFIPIIENRDILPPTNDNPWNAETVQNIVYGLDLDRISNETFLKLKATKVRSKQCVLAFNIIINGQSITFTALTRFKTSLTDSLMTKLQKEIDKVKILKSNRRDYYHLSKKIGNDTNLISKKLLLVGAGSLGSYVAREIVKVGVCNLTIYDADKLESDNILRHTSRFTGINKAILLKYELQLFHEEIHVDAVDKNISIEKLVEESKNYDMIIFTVGESDFQLAANKALRRSGYKGKAFFVWLEAGGEYSHILIVDYQGKGCFECLYTADNGQLVNNKVNIATEEVVEAQTIRTGCGGTRVAYGNSVLLRTVSVLLKYIASVFNDGISENTLVNISSLGVSESVEFIEKACDCCGID